MFDGSEGREPFCYLVEASAANACFSLTGSLVPSEVNQLFSLAGVCGKLVSHRIAHFKSPFICLLSTTLKGFCLCIMFSTGAGHGGLKGLERGGWRHGEEEIEATPRHVLYKGTQLSFSLYSTAFCFSLHCSLSTQFSLSLSLSQYTVPAFCLCLCIYVSLCTLLFVSVQDSLSLY